MDGDGKKWRAVLVTLGERSSEREQNADDDNDDGDDDDVRAS